MACSTSSTSVTAFGSGADSTRLTIVAQHCIACCVTRYCAHGECHIQQERRQCVDGKVVHTNSNFHGLVSVLRRQSTRGTPRHQPGYGVDQRGVPPVISQDTAYQRGNPITSLKFTCCWPSDLLQRKLCQVLYSLEICLGLTFCSHCILLCIPNSAPVLKVLVASLLSCMSSLVVTERHTWVQHLGWCELVLCSLICNIKSFWLGMLNAAQDCLHAGAVSICPSDKIIWFEKHVILCVNFLDDHHNHCPLWIVQLHSSESQTMSSTRQHICDYPIVKAHHSLAIH